MKSVPFYLERYQRYGVLKKVQLFAPPAVHICLYFRLRSAGAERQARQSVVVPPSVAGRRHVMRRRRSATQLGPVRV